MVSIKWCQQSYESICTRIHGFQATEIINSNHCIKWPSTYSHKSCNRSYYTGNGERIKTYDDLLVSGMDRRPLSVSVLMSRGLKLNFGTQWCSIMKNGQRWQISRKRQAIRIVIFNQSGERQSRKLGTRFRITRLGHISVLVNVLTECECERT